MPRKPRLDAPGLLYHVIGRGIERRQIFRDDKDRNVFLSRLGDILKETATPIYAFALIPNHFHLLLRRSQTPISTVMRRLLTGYAIYFNKRHKRVGYLFQNRYKATICQDDPYLLELVRYINLNPIRAGQVESMSELKNYPFSAHSYILGERNSDWFDPDALLSHFAKTEKRARNNYVQFVSDGLSVEKRPDLVGGGLKRSLGYPEQYPSIKTAFDDRVLGEGSFVEELLSLDQKPLPNGKRNSDFHLLLPPICAEYGITESQLLGDTKQRKVAEARAVLAYKMSKELGLSGSAIARELSLSRSAVSKMIRKAESIGV